MRTSRQGIEEIIASEAICLDWYRDVKGIPTIGVGHTLNSGMPDPISVGTLTLPRALRILQNDLLKFERRVNRAFHVPLKQHEFDAAVSFDFNTGRIHDATWVKRINTGDKLGARAAFLWFNKPSGIIARRRRERDLFFEGRYTASPLARILPVDLSSRRPRYGQPQMVDLDSELRALFGPADVISEPVKEREPKKKRSFAALIALILKGLRL